MTKLLGLAMASFLSTVQFAGAVSYGAHEDSVYSSDGNAVEARRLKAQLDELRHQPAGKQEFETPFKFDNFNEKSASGASQQETADDRSLVLSSSDEGSVGPAFGESVTPVPIASAGWLLLGSIGGLGLMRRKRRT